MKNFSLFLYLFAILFASASGASAQKIMQVTVINDSPEPVIGVNAMTGSIVTGSYRSIKAIPLSSPVKSNGRSTFNFTVDVHKPYVYQGVSIYATKYAIEVVWGGGCKKIIDLNYELASQNVNAGAKQCGLYKYELKEMETAKRDADRYYGEKDHSLAESYYSRIIKIDPKNEHALHRRGHSYVYLKKFAEAAADFTAALAVSSDPAHLYGDRGNAYYGAKEYAKAAADFSRAYELAPANTLHLKNRWAAVCRSGNKEAANADQKKLLEIGVTLQMTCEEWLIKQPSL